MPRFLLLASYILASLHASILLGANYPVDGTLEMYERYPGTPHPTTITFLLPATSDGSHPGSTAGDPLTAHEIINPAGKPPKGTITSLFVGQSVTYLPDIYNDQNDTFGWQARNAVTGNTEQYTAKITTFPVNNPPEFSAISGNAFSFNENQAIVGTVEIFDPDSDPNDPNDLLRLDVNGSVALQFDANLTDPDPSDDYFYYTIWYTPSARPNFEALPTTYSIDLNATDWDSGGSIVNQTPPVTITVTLLDVQEAPEIVSTENPIARTMLEDEDTSTILGFTPMEIVAYDPESSSDPANKIRWSYASDNSVIGGVVKLNGVTLAAGADSAFFDSGTLVTVDYAPSADSFGLENLTFTAKDSTNRVSPPITVKMTVDPVDSDPISLNQPVPVSVNFAEEGTGTVWDYNPTDPDSAANPVSRPDNNLSGTDGAEIYYTLSGADATKFQVSAIGELTFVSPPDYETPLDAGGAVKDNNYTLTVQVRDNEDPALSTTDSQTLSVVVTPINELPTLNIGIYDFNVTVDEDVTWTWDPNDFSHPDLNATDVDAGHQAILDWSVKPGKGGLYGSLSVAGTGATPNSFTYVPDLDFRGDGNVLTQDDDFVLQLSDRNGTGVTEITFRVFLNPLPDPPRITNVSPTPVESISVFRDRYTIYLDENNPPRVRLEFNEVDGDSIGNVEILNQSLDKVKFDGALVTPYPYWTPGNNYADFNFSTLHLPDFENNQSSDGDGNYSLIVRISDNDPTPMYEDIYLDFIIQDVNEAPVFSTDLDVNQTAPENQTHAATLSAVDPEGVTSFYWEILHGNDKPKFELSSPANVSSPTVDLRFKAAPNFENPLDEPFAGDKNNTYTVNVQVLDAALGGKSSTQTFVITVTDENDDPTITPVPLSIDEPLRTNAMLDLSQYASDEDNLGGLGGDTLTWAEISGDTTSFALDQNGTLRFNQESDYETTSSFLIGVKVDDGRGGSADANFTVEVNAVDEAPEFFESTTSNTRIYYLDFTLAEDTSLAGDLSNYARDPETGTAGLVFQENFIDYNGTNDANGTLVLNPFTGVFTFTPKPNYSGMTFADFLVSDGLTTGILPVVFTVTEVPDPSVVRESNNSTPISGLTTYAIAEGNSTFKIDLNASDPHDTPSSTIFIWSLLGDDASHFKIEPNPGPYVSLSFRQTPDFETPHDSTPDNRYDFNFTVTDGGNSAVSYPIQITILDDDEPPYFNYGDGNKSVTFKVASNFEENTTGIVFDANASDWENNPIVFSLTDPNLGNGPDNDLFDINPSTGLITFKNKPDYETPLGGAGDNNNTYVLEVEASDASSSPMPTHLIYVTVTNVVEPPIFTPHGSTRSVDWHETSTPGLNGFDANLTYTDDDNQDLVLEISGGVDGALFTLNVATGFLTFDNPPDYENPGSADSDNVYEVQIMIVGTTIVQDLNVTVRDENDAPVITNTGLTQLTIPENQAFVVDLAVSDQDSGPEYKDILYSLNNSTRYVAHTGVDTAVSSFYPSAGSNLVDNNLPNSTFSVSGDFDKDGDMDVLSFEKSTHFIHYNENNDSGPGVFKRKTGTSFDSIGSGEPDHAVVTDLDQDGDLDVVVSFIASGKILWFENNKTGDDLGTLTLVTDPVSPFPPDPLVDLNSTSELDFFELGDIDGDSYPDIVVADRGNNRVDWYKNDGSVEPAFTLQSSIMDATHGLDSPRFVELVDLDGSGTLDVLISANNSLYLASNQGKGVYGVNTFSHSVLASVGGADSFALTRSTDLTDDDLIDVAYLTNSGAPAVLVQTVSGFENPKSLPADPVHPIVTPSDLAIIPATDKTRVTLVVSDASIPYVSLFEAKDIMDGQFEQPVLIDVGTGVNCISLVDLNRQPDSFTYSFIGGEDQKDFNDTRFKNEGRLFLKYPPDSEKPVDASKISRYDVRVKVDDGNGGSTVQDITVSVIEYNEAPVITSLDGNYSSFYEHNETNLTSLFDVNVTHDEYKTQTIVYSVWGGADREKFQIDPTSGRLTFATAPDFEANASAAGNNAYNVIVRVTDNGQPSAYDEQNITINVVDGYEPADFDTDDFESNPVMDEDGVFNPILLSATDSPNNKGTIAGYGIHRQGNNGTASATGAIGSQFIYVPDGNFTGTDVVVVEVNNSVGLTTTHEITITVNSINDLPVFKTPFVIDHPENKQDIITLQADDDSNTVFWSWTDPKVTEDTHLQLDKLTGDLRFRISPIFGPDFDVDSSDQANFQKTYTREIRVTDLDGNFTDANFTINVENLNDNPPLSPHLFANASSTFTLQENSNFIIDLNASDQDNLFDPGFNNVLYSIAGGADQARFTVSGPGILSMLPAADYEYWDSADYDNIYQFTLTLSDGLVGGYSRDYPMVVTITDADENAPSITSNGGGFDANFSHPENELLVTQVKATDVETDVFTYSIWGGADMSLFEINGTTGNLYFKTGANFEKPTDSDLNNLYEVWVHVSDGYSTVFDKYFTDEQKLNIRIRDVDEIPTVSPAMFSTNEDEEIIVTFTISDPEGKNSDASLLTPTTNGYFSWSAYPLTSESDVKFTYTPNPDFHGTDYIVLRVTDGTEQGDVTIPIEINATADPPTANPDVFIYDDPTVDSILLDVLANDSSLPDSNTSDTLTFTKDAWTQPKYGTTAPSVTGGIVPYYIPAKDFIGVDTFQYTIFDSNDWEEATATVTVIIKRAAKYPNWRFSDKVGYYNLTTTNWVYHTDLGWLYLEKPGGLETTTWVWSDKVGWFWTGEEYAPNVYLNDLSGWFAFTVQEAVGDGPKKYMTWPIYDQTKKKWMTEADLKTVRVNTVLSQFDSLDKVISFVLDSVLFTPAEKNAIKTELLSAGRSKTLESMGFTLGE
ncbi:MAG: tandem-95 repeat protein [Opitutae bacterium]|nr:tandem-95 repeat protein [Opitutae bacterium]